MPQPAPAGRSGVSQEIHEHASAPEYPLKPGGVRGLAVLVGLAGVIAFLATRVDTGADDAITKLGRVEVTARLVERPDQFPQLGAYRYTYVLKYKVISVLRQDPEGKYPLKPG